jgi:predicted TIM-barrel fold metal-dependent hydrolase
MSNHTVDFHAHIIPEVYSKALRSAGFANAQGALVADGYPVPRWSVDDTLRCMDKHDIAVGVLSVSSPGTQFLPIEDNRHLCRQLNEELAAIVQAHPRRFATLAALPLPDVDAALKEIDVALDHKGFDGIGLFSSYQGRYLGDPLFDRVFAKLNDRQALIFIHPVQPVGFDAIGLGLPSPVLEFPFDSTRMLTNLLRSGTLTRFDRLKIVVPHGGGTVPYLAMRIAGAAARFPGRSEISIGAALRQLKSVFYDLTAMGHTTNLATLKEFVSADHLLVGYDYPYMPEATIAPHIRTFDAFAGFSEEEKSAIRTGNAIRLLPRLKAVV